MIGNRLRKKLRRRRGHEAAPAAPRGLGEPPTAESADDAELDSLRGELVRELDKRAADQGGSARLRRA